MGRGHVRAVRGMLAEIKHPAIPLSVWCRNLRLFVPMLISSRETLCGGKPGGTLCGGTPGGLARPSCFGAVPASRLFRLKSLGVRGINPSRFGFEAGSVFFVAWAQFALFRRRGRFGPAFEAAGAGVDAVSA